MFYYRSFHEQRNLLLDQEIKNKRLENEINKQREFIIQLKKTLETNLKLSRELEDCHSKLSNQSNIIRNLEINNAEMNQLLYIKNQNINELEEIALLSKNQLTDFSASLAYQFEENERLKRNCQIFRLKRIGNLGSFLVIPTLLIIRRDLQDNYLIELENHYSKIVLNAKDIIELSLCKEKVNKFHLVYKIPVKFHKSNCKN